MVDEVEICNSYINGCSVKNVCKQFHIGEIKLRKILLNNNIRIRKQTDKRIARNFVVSDYRIKKYVEEDGYHYVAISKIDQTEYNDYENKGGFLTSYIKDKLGIEIPSLYDRRIYYQTTGDYWWEQWFDIVKIKNKETKKCPYCDWKTVDVNNSSGMFLTHILKEHNITKEEHLKKHPEDREYLKLSNKTLERQFESNKDKYVTCAICGKKLSRIDWRHLDKHNISKDEYKRIYGYGTISNELRNHLKKNAININLNMTGKWHSKAEYEINDFLNKNGIKTILGERKVLGNGQEIDIYLPDYKLGIEYNGIFYHSEWGGKKDRSYHYNKTKLANEKGIRLIQIFEDEYVNNKNIVLSKISHIIGIKQSLPKVYGRKCKIKEIDRVEAETFLNKHHIQGYASSTVYLGAYDGVSLVGVMTFKEEVRNSGRWDLNRFASDNSKVCCGVGGKLFKYFITHYNPFEIKSFADRRWTVNTGENVYTKLGFEFAENTKPNYTYINTKSGKIERYHKFGFRKQKLNRKYGLPLSMTESEMVKELGYDRIWDCGLIKYVWERNKNTWNQ